jgi:hypothetical protein
MSKVLRIVDGKLLRIGSSVAVTLPANDWKGEGQYEQVVTINSVTPNSKIDIQVGAEAMSAIVSGGYRLLLGNNNGTITAYAVGAKPSTDLTIQLTITEVEKDSSLDVIWSNVI